MNNSRLALRALLLVLTPFIAISTSTELSKASGSNASDGQTLKPAIAGVAGSTGGTCLPDSWDTTFTQNGANGDVLTMVSDGAGNTYVGGEFTSIQGIPLKGIAKWDGSSWSSVGGGVAGGVNGNFDGAVHTILISGTDIYIGGHFTRVGGMPALNVAKWDGTSWSAFGSGLGTPGNEGVRSMAMLGTELFVGGTFFTGSGAPQNGIARWNGSAWTSAGTGSWVDTTAIAVWNGDLYIGGGYGIAKWNGSNWTNIGVGGTGPVNAIELTASHLYIGGRFTLPGSISAQIAKWDGSTWTRVAWFSQDETVLTLAFAGTDLFAGGTFRRQGGLGIGNGVIKYNGTEWSPLGSGTELGNRRVNDIAILGGKLLVGGDFALAGGSAARNIAAYDPVAATWTGFPGTGLDAAAAGIAVLGTDVYVGGSFISAGPLTANRVAKWNSVTETWSSLDGGIFGFDTEFSSVAAMAVVGGKVYAAGSFPRIGGVTANNIAVWDGTDWAPLGTGLNGRASVLAVKGSELIVGGEFTSAGGVSASRLAKWNGTSWSGFASNTVPNTPTGIAFVGNDMYVASNTTTVENPHYLAKFDGAAWTGVAPGMGGHGVSSVVASGSDVYITGSFNAVGGVTAIRIARWNSITNTWSAVGSGLPSSSTPGSGGVRLGMIGNDVIASGDFTVAAGGPANYIARWNGSAWSPLGNGLDTGAGRIIAGGGDLFVGGGFTRAGCNQSPFLARWRENVWTGSTNTDWHTNTNWGSGSVPAANAGITIGSNNLSISSADVTLSSLIVTNSRTVTIGAGRTLTVNGRLDLSGGTVTGPGALVVNGELGLLDGNVTDLGSVVINGNLVLQSGKISGAGPVSVTNCMPGAISGGGSGSFVSSPLSRCVNGTGTYRFPVGTGTVYSPIEVSGALGIGTMLVEPKSGAYAGGASGLPTNRLQRWWNLTNGGLAQADITAVYVDAEVVGRENWYRAYTISGSSATQLPTVINTTTNRANASGMTAFSAFTLAEGTPAPQTLFGRVTNPNGRGAANVLVSLTDDLGNIRYAITNPFGYYRFASVLTFKVYAVRVTSKKFTFASPERSVEFDEFTAPVNFVSVDN